MTTLKLKPNSRKTPPLKLFAQPTNDWKFGGVGEMRHNSGFSIKFFNNEECEISNIPIGMSVTEIRELTSKAIKVKNKRS